MTAALSSARRSLGDDDDEDAGGRMSFLEHLEDLRTRIIHSCIALGVGMAVAFGFMSELASFVLAPTRRVLPPGTDLISSRPTETFAVSLDIAMMAGLVLAAPFIMYQVWLFVVPALYANEKKHVIPSGSRFNLNFDWFSARCAGSSTASEYDPFESMTNMRTLLILGLALLGGFEAAAQVSPPAVQPSRRSEPTILCGMTIVPADPRFDQQMVKPAPEGAFTLRTVNPRICRNSFPPAAAALKRALPLIFGPKR